MSVNSKQILEDINNNIRNREIFKLNRAFLVKSLVIASTKVQYMSFIYSKNMNMVDQVIEQFRAILKFIFSVDNENGIVPTNDEPTITEFSKMILEFVDNYTPIRNYLDQCIIGTRKIQFDEDNKTYFEEKYDAYSNYARMLDKVKEYPNEELKQKTLNNVGSYLSSNRFKPNLFKDRYFYALMNDYREICRLDSEIKFDYDFGDFTYEELISFCAALKIMADYYSFMMMKEPCPVIPYESLVYGIARLSDLSKDKVKFFLKYQTYDYEYQKDKLTLIQGLIRCGDNYYFYPTTLNIGMLPVKMYRLIHDYDKAKYKKEMSKIAKEKELQMTSEIVDKLKKYDVKINTNYKLLNGKQTLAEYDMLVLDNITKNLYVCEFKWHFIGDGESEHKFIDDLLEEEINHRKEKDKYLIDNPNKICKEVFDCDSVKEVKEILISQNFSGNTKHSMPVIDFETLQWNVERHETFEELMNYFLTDEFRESIQVDTETRDYEIEGYKFKFYCMVMKRDE